MLQDQAVRCVFEPVAIFGPNDAFAADVKDGEPGAANSAGAVIGHVKVQMPVPSEIAQSHGGAPKPPDQTGVNRLGEMAGAVIDETAGAHADAVDQQIEITVAINVGKHRSGRELVPAAYPGL